MSERSIESAVYPFEGLLPDLEAMPIAARRALELAGLRLPLEGWRSLSLDDRQRLALAGAADSVDVERVLTLLRRANPPPQRMQQGTDPEASAPPEAIVRALEPSRPLDARRWSRMRALDRYALVHTFRRASARSSFMMLGEAFDAIIAGSAVFARIPQATPSSSGGFGPPTVTTKASSVSRAPAAPPASRPGAAPPAASEGTPMSGRSQQLQETGGWAGRTNLGTSPGADETQPASGRTPPSGTAGLSTHLTEAGEVHMIDVARKAKSERRALATATVRMRPETAQKIASREAPKGEVLATARIAGIMAAKRTPELIPLCHAIALTRVSVDIEVDVPGARVIIVATAEAYDRTGVEMEALTAASVAGLTIYDMLKGTDREMVMSDVKLLEKSGGRSGHFQRREPRS